MKLDLDLHDRFMKEPLFSSIKYLCNVDYDLLMYDEIEEQSNIWAL
jgi:hypothetical protein